MLQNVRDYIIAIHVSCKVKDSLKDLIKDSSDLTLFTMFKHPLNDTASELMNTHFIHTRFKRIDNELYLFRRDLLNYLLDNMIAVRIFDASNYVWFNFLNDFIS